MILRPIGAVSRISYFHSPILSYRRLLIHPRASPWNSALRVIREYAWVFFLKAVLAHPVKTVRGLRRYRHFIREKKHPGPEYVRLLSIPDDAIFLQNVRARKSGPLIGLGFCLKPHEPNDSSASCPSGRANHDCLYLERGETRPVCAGCVIHEIGRLAAGIRISGMGGR